MQKVKDASFRSFYHQLVYVRCAALIEDVMPEVAKAGDTGLVLYGYIDEEAGRFVPTAMDCKRGRIDAKTCA